MRISRLSRSEQQAQTRAHLRQAARQEFASCGVGAASIDRITQAAGFSRGAFYANYSGKYDVLLELLEDHQQREIDTWQSILATEGSLGDILPIMQDRFDAFVLNTDAFLFDFELRIQALRDPAIAQRYRAHQVKLGEQIDALAANLIGRAGVKGVSASLLSMALRSFCPQLALESRLGLGVPGQSAGTRLVALIVEFFGVERAEPAG